MSVIVPYFSARARARRAALKALRRELPGALVEFVIDYPVPAPGPDGFRQPGLLAATKESLSIRRLDGSTVWSAPWSDVELIGTEPAADAPLVELLVLTVKDAVHPMLGVHSSGTFALSPQQVRRMAGRFERARPTA